MNYELGHFEKWLKNDVHPESFFSNPPTEKDFKRLLLFAATEKDRVCKSLIEVEFSNPNANIHRYVQLHQAALTSISDMLMKYTEDENYPVSPDIAEFYKKVCDYLENILTFLQQFRTAQFSFDLPKTAFSVDMARITIRSDLQSLLDLYTLAGAEKALINLALQPVKEFIDNGKRITYRELEQLEELTSELDGLLKIDEEQDFNYEMHSILLQLNFNFPRYPLYCCYRLDEKLSQLATQEERIERISWYVGMLQQIEHRPGFEFMKGVPSATKQILTSINNTYQYLLKPHGSNGIHPAKSEKIRLSVSVAVLALFIKILIKAGIIINDNNAEVFRIIADAFSTPKSEEVSPESLKGKYNKTPITAYRAIRELFISLMTTLKNV